MPTTLALPPARDVGSAASKPAKLPSSLNSSVLA